MKSYVLSPASSRGIYLCPKIDGNTVQFHIVGGTYGKVPKGFDPTKGQVGNKISKCAVCGHTYTSTEMRKMFSDGKGWGANAGCRIHASKKTGSILF